MATQVGNAIRFAQSVIGTPYVWGGESSRGYDCSGLIQAAYRAAGVNIPRTTYGQIGVGKNVAWGQFQPGDLIFSNWEGGHSPEHVVMYIGNGKVIAAPHTGTNVQVESVSDFAGHFVGARRILAGGQMYAAAHNIPVGAGASPGAVPTRVALGGPASAPSPGNPGARLAAQQMAQSLAQQGRMAAQIALSNVHPVQINLPQLNLPTAQGQLGKALTLSSPQSLPMMQNLNGPSPPSLGGTMHTPTISTSPFKAQTDQGASQLAALRRGLGG